MQRLEVSGAVRPIYGSLGVKRLMEPAAPILCIPVGVRNAVHTINLQEFGRQKLS